jgi:hypothetical protein
MKPPPPLIVIKNEHDLELAQIRVKALDGAKKGSAAEAERLGWAAAILAHENRVMDPADVRPRSDPPPAMWVILAAATVVVGAIGFLLFLS